MWGDPAKSYGSPVHKHPVQLVYKEEGDGVVNCGACGGKLSGQMYRCDPCDSYFHDDCANLEFEIKTFFHPCKLALRRRNSFTCNCCFQKCYSVYTYYCYKCEFDMDVGCARKVLSVAASEGERERERILHCCHPHPLQPLPLETKSMPPCRICKVLCSSQPIWGCVSCNFHLHKFCLDLLPQTILTSLDELVDSWILATSPYKKCEDCEQPINSNLVFVIRHRRRHIFLCISCCLVRKMLESNLQYPKVINWFFHQCLLRLAFSPFATCDFCSLKDQDSNFYYHCGSCDFFLGFDCFRSSKISHEEEAKQIRHFCHWHPLKHFVEDIDSNTLCKTCENSCLKSFYGCSHCQFYIHKSCMDILPQNVVYPLLNQTIILLPDVSFDCTTCNCTCSGLTFYCKNNQYKFCVKCILWPLENEFDDSGRFKSIHHLHQLISGYEDKACCFMCGDYYFGSGYQCKECNIFFHKSCAELPRHLQHPIHPHHPLALTFIFGSEQVKCNLCLKTLPTSYNGFYQCKECNIQLDTRCASFLPSVEYQEHPHLLYVLENIYERQICYLCKYSCKGPSLYCAECNFSLHLLCGPLPYTIKHASHVHPLEVQDYYVEDNASEKFACHVCEKHRDPRQRIYQCAESCLIICEVECVLQEVLASLRGEYGGMELGTMYPKIASKVITRDSFCKEIMHANVREKDGNVGIEEVFSFIELVRLFKAESKEGETFGINTLEEVVQNKWQNEERTKDAIKASSNNEDQMNNLAAKILSLPRDEHLYLWSGNAIQKFTYQLEKDIKAGIDDKEVLVQYDGSRMAGDYLLPETLNSVYKDFFGVYDVFSPGCKIGYDGRRLIVFIICSILHEMRMTKVVDVPRGRILTWLRTLEGIKGGTTAKLSIHGLDYLVEHIWRIARAHYIVQAKDIIDTKSRKLNEENEKLSVRLEELIREQKEVQLKLEENEVKRKEHGTYRAAGASELKREYYDALEIKWRWCCEFPAGHRRKA